VRPDTPILEAHDLMTKYSIDGVPVVTEDKKLVGILTEYDLLTKGSAIHLPTFQRVLTALPVNEADRKRFREAVEEITKLRVKDVMNTDPLTLSEKASLEEVVATFRAHHRVNPIPVVDAEGKVVGVVSRFDVLKLFAILRLHGEEEVA
jgi:CBS domain-containing protein